MVYHIQSASEVVELIQDRFFDSEAEAWAWFHEHYDLSMFIEPEAVKFSGFSNLMLERPGPKQAK
jgi:hypothetical protein